ncbi:hypothetical protein BGZ72_008242 [Mortierella alpina]|nr:hypothetical protein BGZ72_008242 [Mortierella alpina]
MKFTTALILIISYVAVAAAHGGLLVPKPRGGYESPQYNGRFHAPLGFKDSRHEMKFPCGGYKPVKPTKMKADDLIEVRFYASGMNAAEMKTQPSPTKQRFNQARHGGGMCEFSLSYDNGRSFVLIGRYTKTCPDSYYKWPVRIPKNIKPCTHQGCLFVWTWTANILPQFYMNCADIRLTNKDGKHDYKTNEKVQFVDFKGRKQGVRARGDGEKRKAGGKPIQREIDANSSSDKRNLPKVDFL